MAIVSSLFGSLWESKSFFKDALGVPYQNWGAYDERNNRIFLCLWSDQIRKRKGIRRILLLDIRWSRKKARERHIEKMRAGCLAYAIICEPNRSRTPVRIKSFNEERLFVPGRPSNPRAGLVYAQIVGEISVDELHTLSGGLADVVRDVGQIENDANLDSTTREALIEARVGQGKYRVEMLKRWSNRCAVTGCLVKEALRASHAKRWSESNNTERLDPDNGLPLVATLDALFGAGLIAFDATGRIQVSRTLSPTQKRLLGLSGRRLRRKLNKKQSAYLQYHRDRVFNSL